MPNSTVSSRCINSTSQSYLLFFFFSHTEERLKFLTKENLNGNNKDKVFFFSVYLPKANNIICCLKFYLCLTIQQPLPYDKSCYGTCKCDSPDVFCRDIVSFLNCAFLEPCFACLMIQLLVLSSDGLFPSTLYSK